MLARNECGAIVSKSQIDDDPSWWDEGDLLMAVDLGYDESGDDKTILVSMQVAVVQKAKKLKTKWRSELRDSKNLPYFHSIDFGNYTGGIFKELNRSERTTLLNNLSRLIRMRCEIGLSVWVDIEKYNRQTEQPFRSKWGAAYTHAVHTLVLAAYLYCKHFALGFDVNIILEGGHRNSDQAYQILDDVRKINGQPGALLNILTVSTGDKKNHPILQAADMLAYSEWQQLKNGKREIYDSLHVRDSKYRPEVIPHDDVLVQNAVEADANWKLWGERKPK